MKTTKYIKLNENASRGEVFTPVELVRDILSKIPKEIFINKNSSFLVPSIKEGNFLIELVRMLVEDYGFSIENAKSRVIGIDNRLKFVNNLKIKGYNVYHKDFLKEKFNMKFDVIIGNPPYQESVIHGKKITGNGSLWVKFTLKSLELAKDGGYVGLVIPDSWTAPTYDLMGSRESIFNDYFKKFNLTYVNFDVKKHFNNVGITPSVFILKKSNDYTSTEIQTPNGMINLDLTQMKFIPKDLNLTSLSIHSKILKNVENLRQFKMRWKKEITSVVPIDIKNTEYKYKWIDAHAYKPIRYSNIEDIDMKKRKVLIPRVGKYQCIVDDIGELGASQYVSVIFLNDNESGLYSKQFFNSKLICFIMNTNKWTQYQLAQILNYIPITDFSQEWTDEKIYKHFELTNTQISYIENYAV